MMTPIVFTHANTKRDVVVTREMVWNIYYSSAHAATHLVSNAGAIIPVSESVDEVKAKVYGSPLTSKQGDSSK